MTSFAFIDETFDPNISLSYFLSIQINLDGFSFCTLDPVRNKYIQFRYVEFDAHLSLSKQLEKCFEDIEILNLAYKKTLVLIPSRFSTLVPTGIFTPELRSEWLRFCIQPNDNQRILYNKVKMADAFNVFAIPEEVYKIMARQFPEPVFFHQYTPIIESNLTGRLSGNEFTSLYIHLNNDYFDIVAFEKNHLKLCNSFPIKSDNDFIYFTLFVFEQLKLESANTEVIISGYHPEYSNLFNHLSTYIRNVKQSDLPGHFQYCYHFRENRMNSFVNLLNLASCV